MQNITEQQIAALAPNASAAANGKKLVSKGSFVSLACSSDDSFYMGECAGSGSSNYRVTADFVDEAGPVCSCSCPSRQYPCKHSLGLLYAIAAKKQFESCEIPEEVLKKREKRKMRAQKAVETPLSETAPKTEKKKSQTADKAKLKKIKTQLEGIGQLKKMISGLIDAGLGTMGGTALAGYRQLAKQLGDYYLPGPQKLLNELILEIEGFQKDANAMHYQTAMKILENLWTLIKKAEQYLDKKLKNEDAALEDNTLYEALGGIWKASELEEIGRARTDLTLIQMGFCVTYDEAAKQYTDTGYWFNLADGQAVMTYNYRPLKALKYIRQEDSIFGAVDAAKAVLYPGEGNSRIRFENGFVRTETEDERKAVCAWAKPISACVKQAKNVLKSPLADRYFTALTTFGSVREEDGELVLRDNMEDSIVLKDIPGHEACVEWLEAALCQYRQVHRAVFGNFWFDMETRRIYMQPLALVSEEQIVRLLY